MVLIIRHLKRLREIIPAVHVPNRHESEDHVAPPVLRTTRATYEQQ
jgi:hypothetical protein